jgi:hypothetical protein
MSEPIPESIPTSADPRSKRPVKKRVLNKTPAAETASQLSALFAKPEQEIRIPSTSTSVSKAGAGAGAPPEIVANVQGSSAGAGSGEFHVYKASRRREYERLRAMDEEVRNEEVQEEWEKEKREREERDKEKTRRNREKRDRLKNKKGKKGGKDDAGGNQDGEKVKSGGGGGGGVKARVDVKGLGMETVRDEGEGNEEVTVQEEVGVIIHDDD